MSTFLIVIFLFWSPIIIPFDIIPTWEPMAEVAVVLGVLAAAGQLAGYATQILSLVANMASDTKSGLRPVLKEIAQVQEFILIAEIIRRDQREASVDVSPRRSCYTGGSMAAEPTLA